MKKILALVLAATLVFSLTACGADGSKTSSPASASESSKKDPAANNLETPSKEAIINDYKEAQDLWSKFEGLLNSDYEDNKVVSVDGYDQYFARVTEPGITTLSDLKNLLATRVDRNFVNSAVDNDTKYKEFDGVLYIAPAGRGDDMSIGWVEFEVTTANDGKSGTLTVFIHRQDYNDNGSWVETGVTDSYDYTFTVESGHAIFASMDYLCGPNPPETRPNYLDGGNDFTFLSGKWTFSDGSSYYMIEANGTYVYYIGDTEANRGYITAGDENSYMMSGEDISNTFFTYEVRDGVPVILFDNGGSVFTLEGNG